MKCLREMNRMKEYLKITIKNLNVIAYFHVASTNYDTSLLGGNCIAEKNMDTHLSTLVSQFGWSH